MTGPLVVIGDALLDRDLVGSSRRLAPDAPVPVVDDAVETLRPGGAALAGVLAAADRREVVVVTAVADDEAGHRLAELIAEQTPLIALAQGGRTAEKTRVRAGGHSLLRLDRGGPAGPVGPASPAALAAIARAGAVLVADYGRGVSAHPQLRAALAERVGHIPVVWDPHPRGATPLPGVRLATPNAAEAALFAGPFAGTDTGTDTGRDPGLDGTGGGLAGVAARARDLVERWRVQAVAVTLGARGALLSFGAGSPQLIPAPPVRVGDPCGAGDRFAVSAATALLDGALPSEAVAVAVAAASAFVAAGGVATVGTPPDDRTGPAGSAPGRTDPGRTNRADAPTEDAFALAGRVRAAGGTVVATGGCFDLVHAGHVTTLRAARELGDCLVVCLNSDDSIRRLKGPDRPLVSLADRIHVLAALSCVDAVAVFDEDTPTALLDRLRPDIWAKGGDYAGLDLPEAALLERWGGQAVVLPYLAGRSTSDLVRAARAAAPRPNR